MSRRSEIDVQIMDVRLDHTDGDAFTEAVQIAKSLADEIDSLRSQLAHCAAGPWRYDVVNAPINTLLLCWQWTPEGCDWNQIIMRRHDDGEWECGNLACRHDAPIAFATINPRRRPEP